MSKLHPPTVAVVLSLIMGTSLASAQLPQTPKTRLGVDVVSLDGGIRLYGVVMERDEQEGLTLAMEREWVKKTYPELYRDFTAVEKTNRQAVKTELLQRIDDWIEARKDDGLLSTFLRDEKKRLEEEFNKPPSSKKFILALLLPAQVRQVYLQPPQRRKIVGLAWQHNLSGATTTSTARLSKRLGDLNVDLQNDQVDLSRELPSSSQTDKQWSAKVALVEHALRPALEYQGTGNMLVNKDEAPDGAALLSAFKGNGNNLASQLAKQLGLGGSPPPEMQDWWKAARIGAERGGYRGVLVIRMEQDYSVPDVVVEAHFFARNLNGIWFEVKRFKATSNINEETPQTLQRLRQEPQIKEIFDQLEGLGLSAANSQMELALRHGAATETSLNLVRNQFEEFLGTFTQQLDTPSVPVK